ncbi:MAG: glycerol-3-phosphate 1-O-acyltransferase PlsY [Planctomycetota bacterium]|nr:glycerol-3-phosphate 1-O-acyltransferase PlsY [Planctomycetota bacterium]MDA1105235.1 glycerol-3-phosphate 1-O-acyltransferase PlsY [Planctomycetota bacterium]
MLHVDAPGNTLPWTVGWIVSFVCGSIPFGLLIARAKGIDIRTRGSGNIGATNVGRVLGKPLGYLCFLLDALKGALPVLWVGSTHGVLGTAPADITPEVQLAWFAMPVCAVLGHMFTPFAGFKGGKGVATAFGGLLTMWSIATIPVLAAGVVFAVVTKVTRYASLGSIVASVALPIAVFAWGGEPAWPTSALSALLGAAVIWKHRSNIARLRAGTENRIS